MQDFYLTWQGSYNLCPWGTREKLYSPHRATPSHPYLSQHGFENQVSESLGEDLSSFAKGEALKSTRTHHTSDRSETKTPITQQEE